MSIMKMPIKKNKQKLKYQDPVRVKNGFYGGQFGVAVDVALYPTRYLIRLNNFTGTAKYIWIKAKFVDKVRG